MVTHLHRRAAGDSQMLSSPKRSALLSTLIHAAVVILMVVVTRMAPSPVPASRPATFVPLVFPSYVPPIHASGGGGGGARDPLPASKGRVPRFAPKQFTPPAAVIRNADPILAMEPTLVGNPNLSLADNHLPNWGLPDGATGPLSSGPGDGGGIGKGHKGGIGDRSGPGLGNDGDNGGLSGTSGMRGTLLPPIILSKVEPEYSDEARRARIQGMVVLSIEIDENGHVRNIQVVSGLGLGLDERAIDAVNHWKFRAGSLNGKPITTSARVEVTFRLL
jgi:protein TonB